MVSFFDCWLRCHSAVTKDPHRLLASSSLDFSLSLFSIDIYISNASFGYQSSPSTHSPLVFSYSNGFTGSFHIASKPFITATSLSLSQPFRIYI